MVANLDPAQPHGKKPGQDRKTCRGGTLGLVWQAVGTTGFGEKSGTTGMVSVP